MRWEYFAGEDEWRPLEVCEDGTEGLAHAGMVEFVCPDPKKWKKTEEFKQSGYWLRLRWELAEFVEPPRVRSLRLNGVEVEQLTSEEKTLGSSNGLPGQSFSLHSAILDSPEIWILQPEDPAVRSTRALSQGTEVKKDANGFWVRWQEVPTFHRSKPEERHFTADLEKGRFSFGDGKHGAVPPKGQNNIKVRYRMTQGASGNVGSGTISVLEKSLPGVQAVTNLHPAEGGCDREDMAHARERGPWEIKHGNRAVTEEDFTRLAKKASVLVGKAACFVENGIINIVVVPTGSSEKPQPSQRLLQEVSSYLDDKRLINTRIRVRGPVYEFMDVEIGVVLETQFINRFGEVKKQLEERLRSFVH
ncbi:MAG: putative baseplate assembly protein, partial [Cyanobacteria bacterium 13_1_40CM_2_61_4]